MNMIQEMKKYQTIVSEQYITEVNAIQLQKAITAAARNGKSAEEIINDVKSYFSSIGQQLSPKQIELLPKNAAYASKTANPKSSIGSVANNIGDLSKGTALVKQLHNNPAGVPKTGSSISPKPIEGEYIPKNNPIGSSAPPLADIPGELVSKSTALVPIQKALQNANPEVAAAELKKIPGISSILGSAAIGGSAIALVAAGKKYLSNASTDNGSSAMASGGNKPSQNNTTGAGSTTKQATNSNTAATGSAIKKVTNPATSNFTRAEEMELNALAFDLEKNIEYQPELAKLLEPYYAMYGKD